MQTQQKVFSLDDLSPRRREVSADWAEVKLTERLTLELEKLDEAGIAGTARQGILNQLEICHYNIAQRFEMMNQNTVFFNNNLREEIDRAPTIQALQGCLDSLPELIKAQEEKLRGMSAWETFESQGREVEKLRGLKADLQTNIPKLIAEHPSLRKFGEVF
jgi:hypothetical protein